MRRYSRVEDAVRVDSAQQREVCTTCRGSDRPGTKNERTVPVLAYSVAVTLVAWALLAFQFVGLGVLALRAVGRPWRGAAWSTAFWIGFAVTIAHLQVWSLFLPVSPIAMLPLLGVSAIGWTARRRLGLGCLARARQRTGQYVITALLCIWAAIFAQIPLRLYDAGIYHLGSIRWASTYPVVAGLGNLGPAYGLNSSSFLYLAAVSVGVPGFHIALGLLVVVLLVDVSRVARGVLRSGDSTHSRLAAYLAALLVLPILVMAGTTGFSTTTSDLVNFVLAIVIGRQLLELLDRTELSPSEALAYVFTIACLGSAAITSKLGIAVFSAAAISLGILAAFGTTRSRRVLIASCGVTAATGIVVVGPWLVRNVILTGYPLYPDPSLALAFDWSMPAAAVRAYRNVLYDFARVNGPDYEGTLRTLAWLGPWLARSWRDVLVPSVFALATPIAVVVSAPGLARRTGRRWLVLVPVWLALVAWFVTAPDVRYAGSLFWLAAGVAPGVVASSAASSGASGAGHCLLRRRGNAQPRPTGSAGAGADRGGYRSIRGCRRYPDGAADGVYDGIRLAGVRAR
jgi:hypothetical protein